MKNKITLFIVLMFAGLLSTQAQGFQKRTVEERVKQSLDRVSDSMQITAAQRTDMGTAFSEFYTSQDKLRDGLAPGTRPERADIEKLVTIRDAKLRIILTEPQYDKFKEMDAAMRKRGNGQRPPGQ